MSSNVFFMNMRASSKENLLDKLVRLLTKSGVSDKFCNSDIVSVKLHFGELGNTAYIRPVYVRRIVSLVKMLGAIPFITDSNTLYVGSRSDAPNHLETAIHNGFSYSVVEAPIIIADGLRGKNEVPVKINRKRFKEVYIAKEIFESDAILSIAHFKGHELSGFGGTIKNLGMGCSSRRGKLSQHSSLSPFIKIKKCIGCGECLEHCLQKAIFLKDGKAYIDSTICIGCGGCIVVCSKNAINIVWEKSGSIFMEKMLEYTDGVLKNKKNKSLFVNFITNVSPSCDCHSSNDAAIVRNIGVLSSDDPVAIDQASVDLVNNEFGIKNSSLKTNFFPGEDKFRGLYPSVDWELQFEYAEKIGLGKRVYDLIEI